MSYFSLVNFLSTTPDHVSGLKLKKIFKKNHAKKSISFTCVASCSHGSSLISMISTPWQSSNNLHIVTSKQKLSASTSLDFTSKLRFVHFLFKIHGFSSSSQPKKILTQNVVITNFDCKFYLDTLICTPGNQICRNKRELDLREQNVVCSSANACSSSEIYIANLVSCALNNACADTIFIPNNSDVHLNCFELGCSHATVSLNTIQKQKTH